MLKSNRLIYFGILVVLFSLYWFGISSHLLEYISPRTMGAIDEGSIVDSVHMLVKNLGYDLEFYTKGHGFYFFSAILFKVFKFFFGFSSSFENVAIYLRIQNLIFLCASIFILFLILEKYLKEAIFQNSRFGKISYYFSLFFAGLIYIIFSFQICLTSNPDFIVSSLGVFSFYYLLNYLEQYRWRDLIISAIFLGFAIHIKLISAVLIFSYGLILMINKKKKIEAAIFIPYISGLLILPSLLLTGSLDQFYLHDHVHFIFKFLFITSVCIFSLLLIHLRFRKNRFLLKVTNITVPIHLPMVYIFITMISFLGLGITLAIGNPYSFHVFFRPIAVSLFVGFSESVQLNIIQRVADRIDIMASIVSIEALLLLCIMLMVYIYKKGQDKSLLKDPIFIVFSTFFIVYFVALNKATMRYMHPYVFSLILMVGIGLNYFFNLKKQSIYRLIFMIGYLILIISSVPNLLFISKDSIKREVLIKQNQYLNDFLSYNYPDKNTIIYADKMIVIPKKYKNYRLIGESNESYFFSALNFPRPDWIELPDLILMTDLGFFELDNNTTEFPIKKIIKKSKYGDEIHTDSPYVNLKKVPGNIQTKYTLMTNIDGINIFIKTKK